MIRVRSFIAGVRRNRRRIAVAAAALVVVLGAVMCGLAVSRAHLRSPQPTLLLHDRHGAFLGEIGATGGGYGYWQVEVMPERVVAATLAIEDRRFWDHPGVDVLAIARAVGQNLGNRRRISGASTLAMQVSRMQNPGSRTYLNKAIEALSSIVLTMRVGRVEVLRHYLRIVPYGNRIHGIAYAARRYLAKPVDDLSWAEVAFLSAIPQAPGRMNPFDPKGRRRAIERGSRILAILSDQGVLSEAEYNLARDQIRDIRIPARGERPDEAMHWVLELERRFADPVHREAVQDRPFVTSSLDLKIQKEVSWQALKAVDGWRHLGAGNAAVIVLDRPTMEVLAWVGSTDYFDRRHKGAIDYLRVERSPGSTLKPFIYGQALDSGLLSPEDILDDLGRGAGGIGNADETFLGPLLPRAALANSRNVPAAELLDRVGLEEGYGFLADLGLHDGRYPAQHWGLGLAIGGMPVSLEQLVGAYSALFNEGILSDLNLYEGQPRSPGRRLLSEATARQITLFLADPMARLPGFPRMGALEYAFPVAAKTGTSSNYHDAWTVAWSRRYVVAAWVGHPDFRPMNRLSGYRSAARLVRGVMQGLHRDQVEGLDDVGFPLPRGAEAVRLCALTGCVASSLCDRVQVEYFEAGRQPLARCSAHHRVAIDRRSGRLASSATPAGYIDTRVFTDLGPRYAAWQVATGLPHPPEASQRRVIARLLDPVPSSVAITSPRQSLRILRDPEAPPGRSTLELAVVVDPPSDQVVWYVDGEPWQIAEYPYTARWPLTIGEHVFEARVPLTSSRSPAVRVQIF